jgi:hypothetical protein
MGKVAAPDRRPRAVSERGEARIGEAGAAGPLGLKGRNTFPSPLQGSGMAACVALCHQWHLTVSDTFPVWRPAHGHVSVAMPPAAHEAAPWRYASNQIGLVQASSSSSAWMRA